MEDAWALEMAHLGDDDEEDVPGAGTTDLDIPLPSLDTPPQGGAEAAAPLGGFEARNTAASQGGCLGGAQRFGEGASRMPSFAAESRRRSRPVSCPFERLATVRACRKNQLHLSQLIQELMSTLKAYRPLLTVAHERKDAIEQQPTKSANANCWLLKALIRELVTRTAGAKKDPTPKSDADYAQTLHDIWLVADGRIRSKVDIMERTGVQPSEQSRHCCASANAILHSDRVLREVLEQQVVAQTDASNLIMYVEAPMDDETPHACGQKR